MICEYYCLNIIVNINSVSTFNISVITSLKFYDSQALNEKLEIMERAMNFFSRNLLGHEIFSFMVP